MKAFPRPDAVELLISSIRGYKGNADQIRFTSSNLALSCADEKQDTTINDRSKTINAELNLSAIFLIDAFLGSQSSGSLRMDFEDPALAVQPRQFIVVIRMVCNQLL